MGTCTLNYLTPHDDAEENLKKEWFNRIFKYVPTEHFV